MNFINVEKRIGMFDTLLNEFQTLYPEYPCVIAGGAVRDVMLGTVPKDLDIYFLGLDWRKEIKTEFKKRLDAAKMYKEVSESNMPWHKYERYLMMTVIKEVAGELGNSNAEVQFMGFPANSLERLLKTFDWEICIFGYTTQGKILTTQPAVDLIEKIKNYNKNDPKYKPPYMKLCNVQFPISNLRRGFKFEARYPIKLEYESVLKLSNAVIAEEIKKGG